MAPGLCSVAVHPHQSHFVATGNEEGDLEVWDLRKPAYPAYSFSAHREHSPMWCLHFELDNPDNLVSGAEDGHVLRWFSNEHREARPEFNMRGSTPAHAMVQCNGAVNASRTAPRPGMPPGAESSHCRPWMYTTAWSHAARTTASYTSAARNPAPSKADGALTTSICFRPRGCSVMDDLELFLEGNLLSTLSADPCIVCLDDTATDTLGKHDHFADCGHAANLCEGCAPQLATCPMCRAPCPKPDCDAEPHYQHIPPKTPVKPAASTAPASLVHLNLSDDDVLNLPITTLVTRCSNDAEVPPPPPRAPPPPPAFLGRFA